MPEAANSSQAISGDPGDFPPQSLQTLEIRAGKLLAEIKVDNPGKILREYKPDRIIEVCEAAIRRKDRIKVPAGYVIRALRAGWAV